MSHGGKREGAGRRPGSKSKRTLEVEEKLAALGCDPIEGLARIANGEAFGAEIPTLDQRQAAYKELAQYVAPKRKAVEHSGSIAVHEETLEALAAEDDGID